MMLDWRLCTIGSLVDEGAILIHKDGNHGANYPRAADFGDEGIRFLTAKSLSAWAIDVENAPRLNSAKAGTLKFGFVQPDDVLLSHNATVGRVALVPNTLRAAIIGTSLTQFRVDASVILPRFLALYFSSRDFQNQLSFVMAQTTRNQVPITAQRQLTVRIPDIDTQRAIADVAFSLIDKIELNRRTSETLEAVARILFRDWFVDFGPVRRKLAGERDPVSIVGGVTSDRAQAEKLAALFPNTMGEDALPSGWRWRSLGDIVSALETGSRPKGGVKDIASGVPSVGAESIVGLGKFDFAKTKFVPPEFFLAMRRGVVRDRDILVYKDGGRPGEFEPHVAMFGGGFPFNEFCINEHVYRVVAEAPFSQEYLYLHLTSDGTMAEMRNKGTGVAIPGLNSTAVRSLTVVGPGHEVLRAFGELVKPLFDRTLHASSETKVLADTHEYLLPRLMTGKVRVADAKVEAAA